MIATKRYSVDLPDPAAGDAIAKQVEAESHNVARLQMSLAIGYYAQPKSMIPEGRHF
jgi:hypothetical protein